MAGRSPDMRGWLGDNMFLQEATPDTSGYMIAGYAIAFIVMGLYVLSIYLRSRNLNQDLTLLEDLDKQATQAKQTPVSLAQKGPAKPARKKSGKNIVRSL